jgi:hypothetical protein
MWKYFEPEAGRWYRWNLNGAVFYLRREGDEWRAVVKSILFQEVTPQAGGPETDLSPQEPPGYFAAASGGEAALRPCFYEKPYYLNFREKVRLMPEAEIRLDLALPPVLRLELAGELDLLRFTPFLLSESWAGDDTMAGFLGVSLPAGFPPSSFTGASSFIHGELILCNHAKTALELDHLVLYTNSLNIYEKEGRLLCETVTVDANSGGELKVNPRPGAPEGYSVITTAKKAGWGLSLPSGGRSL